MSMRKMTTKTFMNEDYWDKPIEVSTEDLEGWEYPDLEEDIVSYMKTTQELTHDVQLQLEYETDLLNGYCTKVADLHKRIRNRADLILNSTPCNLAYHAARIAEYSALLKEYNAEIEMLEQSIQIANADLENLEREV